MNSKSSLSHVEINVGDYARSIRFYDLVLQPLGWNRLVCTDTHTTYSDGVMKLILAPADDRFKGGGFHRKRIGLNHLALNAGSREDVNSYFRDVLQANSIQALYEGHPAGDDEYYSVLFEDPDRMKLEVVYAPNYLSPDCWLNKIPSDFDPYEVK